MLRSTGTLVILGLLYTACIATPADPKHPETAATGLGPVPDIEGIIRTTSGDQTGNRVTPGILDLSIDPSRVEIGSEPAWVVGGSIDIDTAVYVVVTTDGAVTAITVDDQISLLELESLPSPAPPTVVFGDHGYRIVPPPRGASELTAPAVAHDSVVSVTVEGEVSVLGDEVRQLKDVRALGDSRLAVDERGLIAVLSDPGGAYPHGVLGDRVEASTITVFDPGSVQVVGVARAPDGSVFEAVAPMWADVDADGDAELVATASDASEGARLVVYDERGRALATSTPIGRGQRWRHLLGVAEFDGEPLVVDVQTPHIGGIVQWHRLVGESLNRIASLSEYSSHRIGRRNLDQGVIADGDGDGNLDVIVPSQDQRSLAVLDLGDGDPIETVAAPLGSRVSTNISVVQGLDGRAGLAVGLEDGSVLIWR